MDWDLLKIFNKVEFNILMASIAIGGWFIHLFVKTPFDNYILCAAIITSIYCLLLIIHTYYRKIQTYLSNKAFMLKKRQEEIQRETEYYERRNTHIKRFFEGLNDNHKHLLVDLDLKGKVDSQYRNVRHFKAFSDDEVLIQGVKDLCDIDIFNYSKPLIKIERYKDSLSVTVDDYLLTMIEQHIKDDGLHLDTSNIENQ